MIRKPLVNEAVRAFAFSCKNRGVWAAVIFGNPVPAYTQNELHAAEIAPFVVYAVTQSPNWVYATQAITMLAGWMRSFNHDERAYAVSQLGKHYGISIGETQPDLSQLRGDIRQELSAPAIVLECDELLDAE